MHIVHWYKLGPNLSESFFQSAKAGKDAMSLEEVADYAADAYHQPGKERREPGAEAAH